MGSMTRFILLSDICGLHVMGSRIYSFNLLSLSGSSPEELMTAFYCHIWDSPNLEGQVPVFISPRNRVAKLYPRALGSLFVASYDSQGYGGGILTLLHTGHWEAMSINSYKMNCDQSKSKGGNRKICSKYCDEIYAEWSMIETHALRFDVGNLKQF
jgi:hypothetical protein